MSLAGPPGRQASESRHPPGLTLNLATNNPFRKNSPAPSPQLSGSMAAAAMNDKSHSRNPFLDYSDELDESASLQKPISPTKMRAGDSPPTQRDGPRNLIDPFTTLGLGDKSGANENVPPPMAVKSSARPTRSPEEEQRTRNGARPRGPAQPLDVFADPPNVMRSPERRPLRQDSTDQTSTDRNGRPLSPEEERRRRERRLREREARHRHRDSESKGKPRPSGGGPIKSKKPGHLDVIDKLDVTSIYGTGLFHHDGPFDACNPHRNRKGLAKAPMQAFPKDSANNNLGGSGPINKHINLDQFHGHTRDGFTDFNSVPLPNHTATEPDAYVQTSSSYKGEALRSANTAERFNPTMKVEPLHGDESMGLGTSTFLEGAPAAREAIQRRESESENLPQVGGGGLARKRSLAQKIRGISNSTRNPHRGMTSPEPLYELSKTTSRGSGAGGEAMSAGGLGRIRETANNPFFKEFSNDPEKRAAGPKVSVQAREDEVLDVSRSRGDGASGTTQRVGLERRVTEGGLHVEAGEGKGGGGFLSRVKSLRGGRRAAGGR